MISDVISWLWREYQQAGLNLNCRPNHKLANHPFDIFFDIVVMKSWLFWKAATSGPLAMLFLHPHFMEPAWMMISSCWVLESMQEKAPGAPVPRQLQGSRHLSIKQAHCLTPRPLFVPRAPRILSAPRALVCLQCQSIRANDDFYWPGSYCCYIMCKSITVARLHELFWRS